MKSLANFASHLWLYSGVPLDNTYEHTYASVDKLSYKKWAKPPAPMYYIRPDKNTIRIKHDGNMTVANLPLYECNYLKFSNNSYEGIDFYCFVTEVRYINDETAEIDFEIDVMMTWVASGLVTFEQCFVERETTNSDDIGEHILEEPVDIGDYVYHFDKFTSMPLHICVGVKAHFKTPSTPQAVGKWEAGGTQISYENGYYICDGVERYYFDSSGNRISSTQPFGDVQTILLSLVNPDTDGKPEYLAFVYYYPEEHAGTYNVTRKSVIGTDLDYTPKNKKLLTYPYYGCSVFNFEGAQQDYAFELSGNSGTLTLQTNTSTMDASASLNPTNYKQGALPQLITKTKFPVMSASANEYSTYQAQLKAQMPAELISNIGVPAVSGALIGGGVVGGLVGAGAGLISYVAKAYSGGQQAKLKVASTGTNAGFLQVDNGTEQFGIYHKSIRTEYARAIDDFFTKFGYKVNRLKVPSKYNSRLSWKYIKTIGCAIEGEAPASAVSKIQNIMDNGITFWNKPEIGQYTFPS